MKKRILFVDDEVNVLEGLQRMLRSRREEWDMTFVSSGREALDLLARESHHVVVSDLRMPGIDGAHLIAAIARQYPDMVRIILSGHADQDSVLKTVGVAHQFLPKPCDADRMRTTIERACGLRDVLKSESLRKLVSRMDSLPSLPVPYLELLEELRSPRASVERVGKIIAKDMGMTAKILHLINSAFFGLRQRVSDPAFAVSLLGLDTIKSLVLSVQVFKQFDRLSLATFSPRRLWDHSIAVGAYAQAIARVELRDDHLVNDALMAGLLHDIGKLVLAAKFPREWVRVLDDAGARRIAATETERAAFGATHAELGAYLLGLWGMSDPIVESLAFHHNPLQLPTAAFSLLTAVHAANVLEYEANDAETVPAGIHLDWDYLKDMALTARLPAWREACRKIDRERLQCMKESY